MHTQIGLSFATSRIVLETGKPNFIARNGEDAPDNQGFVTLKIKSIEDDNLFIKGVEHNVPKSEAMLLFNDETDIDTLINSLEQAKEVLKDKNWDKDVCYRGEVNSKYSLHLRSLKDSQLK